MKSTVKNNSILKAIAITATTAVLLATNPIGSFANPVHAKKEIVKIPESQIDVQFVGITENRFNFKIEFENPSAQKFTLTVKNDDGEVVYSKEFNDAHFSRTITLVNDNESFGIHPTFAVSVGNRLVQRSFSIERKITQDVVVTKL
jgi:hypothetical protein